MALLSTILAAMMRKAILLGLVFLALFVLVEMALWIFAPVSPYVTYRFEFTNKMEPFGLPNHSTFEVDSREIRHREPAEDRGEEIGILIVGGEGSYQPLQDVEDTWGGRMATVLERKFPEVGIRVDVKAGSRAGPGETSMRHGLRWAKTYAPEVAPEIIVVSFGISEVLDIPPDYTYNPTLISSLPGLPRPGSIKDRAAAVSQIARRLRHWRAPNSEAIRERRETLEEPNLILRSMVHQRALYESFSFDISPPRRPEGADPILDYLDALQSFHALAQRLGAELVVLGEPCLHDNILGTTEMARLKRPRWLKRPSPDEPGGSGLRPDPAWVEAELNRYYGEGEKWAEKAGVAFVNLNRDELLPKSTAHFVDDSTLTLAGSRRVAEEVAPVLAAAIKKFLAN